MRLSRCLSIFHSPSVSSFLFALLFPLLFVLLLPVTEAGRGHLVLLTVAEGDDPFEQATGGTADLYLEIRPGNGQIFLDTFPLSRLETQSSTRYANQVACNALGADCSRYDFLYTIRADSAVVGGPSAGAAIAVLTAAMLQGQRVDGSIAITGTINSGALIGPVGGIAAKALAARDRGLSQVLVSSFAYVTELNASYVAELNGSGSFDHEGLNVSRLYIPVDLSSLPIPVTEVATLGEALAIMTGSPLPPPPVTAEAPSSYTELMRDVAADLCDRHDALESSLRRRGLLIDESSAPPPPSSPSSSPSSFPSQSSPSSPSVSSSSSPSSPSSSPSSPSSSPSSPSSSPSDALEETEREESSDRSFPEKRARALASEDWYSLASYCFADLIRLRTVEIELLSAEERRIQYGLILMRIAEFEENLARREISTLAELETGMIVAERLREAKEALRDQNLSNLSAATLAFAIERHHSANAWSAFFRMESPRIFLDNRHLSDACLSKVAETEERLRYAELYVPEQFLADAQDELRLARIDTRDARYSLCLFRAAKAHARADLLLGAISIPRDKLELLVERKLAAAALVIAQQQEKGLFPIIGHSYHRYASSLQDHDPYSALTFAEYALELSNLDLFFPRERAFRLPFSAWAVALVVSALLLGLSSGLVIGRRCRSRKRHK